MKITDIQIERYGVWNHLALPLPSSGLNVFYGPNEAGKTTLLRFICDVLYQPQSETVGHSEWNGALRLAQGERFCEVRRSVAGEGLEGIEFQELDPALAWSAEPAWGTDGALESALKAGDSAEAALKDVLAGTHARLFRHVFAIGLNELQELSTLEDQEVAEEIYSLSLGLEGRRLLSLSSLLGESPGRSPWASDAIAQIAHLMDRDAELEWELEQFSGRRDRHQQLVEQEAHREVEIAEFKSREADHRRQLSGHETLKRVWEPWNQVREYEAEFRTLPVIADVAGIGRSELPALEDKIRDLGRERKSAIAEIHRLRKTLRSMGTSADAQRRSDFESLLSERGRVMEIEHELELAFARARELQTEFEARQKTLGRDWPIERLVAIDTSHSAYTRLVDAARGFQAAQSRLASFRKRYEKHAAACQQRQTELEQQIETLPEGSVEEALKATREQIRLVEELARLERRERELEQDIARRNRELADWQDRSQVPTWVPGFLLFLAVSGLVLSAVGFYTSLTSNGIAGAILGLVGIAGFAIARAFHLDVHGEDGELSRVQSATREQEKTLAEVRAAVRENTPPAWAVTITNEELENQSPDAVLASKLAGRLAELKQFRIEERRLKSLRRKLSRMRKALQNRQRSVGQSRQDWCDVLKQCGLDENVHIEEAFGRWQKIAETMEHFRAWNDARETAADLQTRHEAFCRRLAEFGERSGRANLDFNHPLRVLDLLEKEFASARGNDPERLRLKRELRDRKRGAIEFKQKMIAARKARRALLAKVGAANREEFEQRLDSAARRSELEELLQMAKEELAELNEADPELAIVEDDLLRYDPAENQEAIDLLLLEIEELESRLAEASETWEQTRQERLALETDRRPSELRYQREILRGKLRECLTQIAAVHLGAKAVGEIRREFEQTSQPRILEIASEYLAQLTCGKYFKIWTPLGERRLLLLDAEENNFSVEQLSTGTREQLFLALRLGLVSEFAQRGIELPMILDDVLVNFDQYRTEAAVQTLIEFAERGHQVLLFTSHLHVARMCESLGINPVWLPGHHAAVEHRRAG